MSTLFLKRQGGRRVIAAALMVCFGVAVLTTGADYCLDSCQNNDDVTLTSASLNVADGDDEHHGHPHALARSTTPQTNDDVGCPGAGCLCHQPRLTSERFNGTAAGPGERTSSPRSPSPPASEPTDIFHVPKSFT